MKNAISNVDPYFSSIELLEIHKMAKNESISQVPNEISLNLIDFIFIVVHCEIF